MPVSATEPRAKVLIWIESSGDEALLERVRGQVSDLDVDLLVVAAKPSADAGRASVLVWFTRPDPDTDSIVVHVAQGEPQRTWLREIGDGAPVAAGQLSSATLETAALVVREALRDVTRAEPPAPELRETALAEAPRPALVARASPLTKPEEHAARVFFRAELAWQLTLDGVGLFRRQGPVFLLGGTYRGWQLSLFAGTSLPSTEEDRYGSIRLRRQVFGLSGGKQWRAFDSFTLELGLRGGFALYARNAEKLSPDVIESVDRVTASLLFGPQLGFGWAPVSGPIELMLSGGLDVVPGAPRIGYQVAGRFEPSFDVWRLQPTLGIGAVFCVDRGR